ncbi:MAG: PTS sugar transporter subunit IIA [Candidatus Omnitrophica bacterium]|nr:PTS sugar transporter subunit IIA [Candidatus Omnitrophota bacterium]
MKIAEFLNEKAIVPDLKATDKEGAIRELIDVLARAEGLRNKEEIAKVLMAREALGSTGIGLGVGIPHGKCNATKRLVASFGISRKGIDFDALDGESVYIFFCLVAPEDSAGPHLKALARISRLLKDKYFRDYLRSLTDDKKIFKAIKDEDAKKP